MLPGKTYTPEDIIGILRKRFWVVLVPWAVVSAVTAVVAQRLPDLYRSTALIQVVPPQVPESIVRSLNPARFDERLQATRQSVLSRARLEALINQFNLYEEERRTRPMQLVVERMRTKDIRVQKVQGEAFTVEYTGRDPVVVQRVAEQLAAYFKDESVRTGSLRAEGTSDFIESAVAAAKEKLIATERKLAEYKMRHAGELPTQLGANLQAIQNIQQNLNSVAQAINADLSTQARLERDIDLLESQADPAVPAAAAPSVGGTAAQRLAQARAALEGMQARRLKPDHPDMKSIQALIRTLEKEADDEAMRVTVGTGAALSPAELARQARLASLRDELGVTKKRLEANRAEEKRLRNAAVSYQAKVDGVPVREAELTELLREYDTVTQMHTRLVAQREAATMSVDVERRQQGEQFNLIDQARLPEAPFSPNRPLIILLGVGAGLAIGVGLIALLEYRDSSFKIDREIVALTGLPVLAVVPIMRSDGERRADLRRRRRLHAVFGSSVAVCLAVLAYSLVF